MTNEITIVRAIGAEDQSVWQPLWAQYLAFYGTEVSDAVYASTFQRILAGNNGDIREFRGALVWHNGQAVGLVHYLFHRHNWKIEDVCYLQDLYVSADVRGSGLGRRLIEHVYDAADAFGAASVYWLTQEHNKAGRRLYDRLAQKTDFVHYKR